MTVASARVTLVTERQLTLRATLRLSAVYEINWVLHLRFPCFRSSSIRLVCKWKSRWAPDNVLMPTSTVCQHKRLAEDILTELWSKVKDRPHRWLSDQCSASTTGRQWNGTRQTIYNVQLQFVLKPAQHIDVIPLKIHHISMQQYHKQHLPAMHLLQ